MRELSQDDCKMIIKICLGEECLEVYQSVRTSSCTLILNTPLIDVVQEDILILKAKKNGQYSV